MFYNLFYVCYYIGFKLEEAMCVACHAGTLRDSVSIMTSWSSMHCMLQALLVNAL